MNGLTLALSLLALVSAVAHIWAEFRGPQWQIYLCKPLTTASILALTLLLPGESAPTYRALIIGGLAFSTVVSLLVVPAFYAAFDTLSAWGRKVMRTVRGWPSLMQKSA